VIYLFSFKSAFYNQLNHDLANI